MSISTIFKRFGSCRACSVMKNRNINRGFPRGEDGTGRSGGRKILFVIHSFAGGGAERLLIDILKHIDRKRFRPMVLTLGPENAYPDEMPGDIETVCLYKRSALEFFRLAHVLSGIIRDELPDATISFCGYANYLTVLAAKLSGRKKPVVISEMVCLTQSLSGARFGSVKRLIVKRLYPEASSAVAVSSGVKEDLCGNYNVSPAKCRVILNSADIDGIRRKAAEEIEHHWFREDVPVIAACGRLVPQKNYPLLLKSMKKVLEEIEARLFVLGAGADEDKLKKLADGLGLGGNVCFAGFMKNPHKYIASSDIFVLSSDWEGFPSVIIDAMACGVPVISTRCPSGPDEIITDGVNGLLVPTGDENSMAQAVLKLLNDGLLRKRLAEAGKRRSEDFRVEKMVAEYEKLFEECIPFPG